MKKKILLGATLLCSCALGCLSFAGNWVEGIRGWWYDRGDGTYPSNGWQWIDGDGDGQAECYYFDADGWMLRSTTTPDGYEVNADGAWVENGEVQRKAVPDQERMVTVYPRPSDGIDRYVTYYGVPNSTRIARLNLKKKLLRK